MKIKKIEGKNIASFEGHFLIDFEQEPMKSAGTFAITGPTGSGKSSLLDVICLALYDTTPRLSQGNLRISLTDTSNLSISEQDSRSLMRKGSTEAYAAVEYETVSGHIYRSEWSVRRARGKQDGNLQAVEMSLTNLQTGDTISGKLKEVKEKNSELVGLTFEQFSRTVLLAQGDFANFLRASENDKAELLEKITGTEIYTVLSKRIFEQYKTLNDQVQATQEQANQIILLSEEEKLQITSEITVIKQAIQSETNEVNHQNILFEWIRHKELLIKEYEQSKKDLQEAQEQLKQFIPLREDMNIIERLREIGHLAKQLRDKQNDYQAGTCRVGQLRQSEITHKALLQEINQQMLLFQERKSRIDDFYQRSIEDINKAKDLDLSLEKQHLLVRREEQNLQEQKKELSKKHAVLTKNKKESQENAEILNELLRKIEQGAPFAALKETRCVEYLKLLHQDKNKLAEKELKLQKEEKIRLKEEVNFLNLKKELEELRHFPLQEIIKLRQSLKEGEPCPVCGSLHHNQDLFSKELQSVQYTLKELENKQTLCEEAEKRYQTAGQTVNELKGGINELLQNTKEYELVIDKYLSKLIPDWKKRTPYDVLATRLFNFFKAYETKKQDIEELKKKLVSLNSVVELQEKDYSTFKERVEQQKKEFTSIFTQYQDLSKERNLLLKGLSVDAYLQRFSDFTQRIERQIRGLELQTNDLKQKLALQMGQSEELNVKLKQLSKEIETDEKRIEQFLLKEEIERVKFDELIDWSDEKVLEVKKQLKERDEALRQMQIILQERYQNLKRHQGDERFSEEEKAATLDFVSEKIKEQTAQIEKKRKDANELEAKLNDDKKELARKELLSQEIKAKVVVLNQWKILQDLFGHSSGNKFKILAQNYTLDALVMHANVHLATINPRYSLERIPQKMAFQLIDHDMFEERRSVMTLSGGETFLISLSLAMGLSSLTSDNMKIESLFIDEGFGSLDNDTLEQALTSLDSIQAQGRKIGVISHVQTMNERIETKIIITKGANGASSLKIIG